MHTYTCASNTLMHSKTHIRPITDACKNVCMHTQTHTHADTHIHLCGPTARGSGRGAGERAAGPLHGRDPPQLLQIQTASRATQPQPWPPSRQYNQLLSFWLIIRGNGFHSYENERGADIPQSVEDKDFTGNTWETDVFLSIMHLASICCPRKVSKFLKVRFLHTGCTCLVPARSMYQSIS